MKTFAKPYWIFLTVTLPHILIILYFLGAYGIIGSLLDEKNLDYWAIFGTVLTVLLITLTIYAISLTRRRKPLPVGYAFISLAVYVVFIHQYFSNVFEMMPVSIPGWMVPFEELFLLPLGLMMPVYSHAILLLVERFTPAERRRVVLETVVGAVVVPASWYTAVKVLFPALKGKVDWQFIWHIQVIFFIVCSVVFMFLVVRLVYLVVLRVRASESGHAWLFKLPFTLVLPLLCFLVYNGTAFMLEWLDLGWNFIGDWSHPAYYLFILINGILISLPAARNDFLRLSAFGAKGFFYPLVVYFFVVFLPFLPFAIDAVVIWGFGFLMLAPLAVFLLHTKSLADDWSSLKARFGTAKTAAVLFACVAVIPLAVTVSFTRDRMTLDRMLKHVYEPDFYTEATVDINAVSAKRVLDTIKGGKPRIGFLSENGKPYLTTYYQWLVMDNLTLSNKRLKDLEQIFFGSSTVLTNQDPAREEEGPRPELQDMSVATTLSEDGKYYTSRVNLTIKNGPRNLREYSTSFKLPLGAWLSDYYLVIDGKEVPGILSEKKSAVWIYQQTLRTERDPGILYYSSTGDVILRVFPFAENEVRTTGFEVMHREPLSLEIDGKAISLNGGPSIDAGKGVYVEDENVVAISPKAKKALPEVQRTPYLHFVVDRSARSKDRLGEYVSRINGFVEENPFIGLGGRGAKITFANYNSRTVGLEQGWEEEAARFPAEGGFFLERAFKSVLYGNYTEHSDSSPVFVVVTDDLKYAVFADTMTGFEITYPEGGLYYVLDGSGLSGRSMTAGVDVVLKFNAYVVGKSRVLAWPDAKAPEAFLPNDGRTSVVVREPDRDFSLTKLEGKSWENGLALRGMWLSTRLHPAHAGTGQLGVIQNSFRTGIMSPLTAFLAPENDAQREMLLKKQRRVLSSMRPLDVGEEYEMSEPPFLALAILAVLFFLYIRRKSACGASLTSGRKWL